MEIDRRDFFAGVAATVAATSLPAMAASRQAVFNRLGGTTYYVSNSGSDGNNGTSPSTPWATITPSSPVNTKGFQPGDSILFQAGGVWRGRIPVRSNGSTAGVINYGSYGTGAKPLFLGSANASGASNWKLASGNLWHSVQKFPPQPGFKNGFPYNAANDIGNVIFLNSSGIATGAGYETFSQSSVNHSPIPASQGQWRFNQKSWQVELYSTSNPGTFYPGIELAIDQTAFELDAVSYITIKGLEFRYYASSGINGVACSNINIAQNTMSWIGGGNLGGSGTRYGNGITFYNGASNCTIEQNLISQVYDTPLSNQGASGTYDGMTWRNNICWNASAYAMFEGWLRSGAYKNVFLYNNTFVSSNSWAQGQRPNGKQSFGIAMQSGPITVSGVRYENNAFVDIVGCALLLNADNQWQGSWTLDYNLWSPLDGGGAPGVCSNDSPSLATWASRGYGEAHGLINIAPKFVNQMRGDFTPATGSPLLNAGVNLDASGVMVDYNGNPRPTTGAFTIGAIQ